MSGWENAISSFYLLPFILKQKEISKIVGAFVLLGKDIQKILGTMPYYTQILGRYNLSQGMIISKLLLKTVTN